MGVAGELQGHAELRRAPRLARLVVEQDDGDAAGSTVEGRRRMIVRPDEYREVLGESDGLGGSQTLSSALRPTAGR